MEGWKNGVLTQSSRAESWALQEVKGGNLTGRRLLYHPGTPRHYNGRLYWEISSGEGGKRRFEAK